MADATLTSNSVTIADYEAVLADHRRLVRQLDVALNGAAAARQASLCDIVGQCEGLARIYGGPLIPIITHWDRRYGSRGVDSETLAARDAQDESAQVVGAIPAGSHTK